MCGSLHYGGASPSLKGRNTFLSPVSGVLDSPAVVHGDNDIALKAEAEIADVSRRIRERLGSVIVENSK